MKRTHWLVVGIVIGLLLTLGVATGAWDLVYVDGPYRGKLIDKATGQPLKEAAVVAVWSKEVPFIAQAIISYYDAQETLTDAQGNFTISGIWGVFPIPLTRIRDPLFTIFKPGYEIYRARKVAPSGKTGRTELALRPLLSKGERRRNQMGLQVDSHVPDQKIPNLIRLINSERKTLGLRPTHVK